MPAKRRSRTHQGGESAAARGSSAGTEERARRQDARCLRSDQQEEYPGWKTLERAEWGNASGR